MSNSGSYLAQRAAHTAKSLRRAFVAARPVVTVTTTWTTITTPVTTMKVKMGGCR
ncbi:hypothetical protein O4H49_16600 [Kiloniella laminariae]|uniref:Uncharacterized protein n=1 Tax=Kiloniella laminariae TaxID=454162 RepID=A0ABT4LMR6_9PROT|nr:hypothetical protein [Kiloniella laminariae]MCZ4282409.1 hypothetical protein [Kiloniella laminariae]